MNIYQEIWNSDLKNSGIKPLIEGLSDNQKNEEIGYIIVDLKPKPEKVQGSNRKEITIFKECYIPQIEKKENPNSYELFKKLLDNYILNKYKEERTTIEQIKEKDELLDYVIESDVMKLAKQYLDKKLDQSCTEEEWKQLQNNIWFNHNDNKDACSGFEHIFIGEQGDGIGKSKKKFKLGGNHFWYHYLLYDGNYDKYHIEDTIICFRYTEVQMSEVSELAEVIAIEYQYIAKDSQNRRGVKLYKSSGGFFIGISVEGLMAITTVAIIDSIINYSENIKITINNEIYNLVIILAEDSDFNDDLLERLKSVKLKTSYPKIIN
ncbi:hypothetical protein [Romboutsia sp.]|uniref:hypothetical protein n=1 Tax=Romboutsia sp. TaxID=1965302 RepID=UPI002BF53782|nr:hypothetical protein [Romboutsia sp.]HSQ89718.1 hypothetical protein [Romboutsia sp.]